MSSDFEEMEKPPAPPVRLTSTKDPIITVDMKPLPKEPDDEKRKKAKMAKPNKIYKLSDKLVISPPSNFEHTVHVGFDPHTGEFTGMPQSWAILLRDANITESEQKKNPQAVLDVLNYYDSSSKGNQESKFMTVSAGYKSPISGKKKINESSLSDQFAAGAVLSQATQKHERLTPPSADDDQDNDSLPPPIAARPEKTLSIYTKPIESSVDDRSNGQQSRNERLPKKEKNVR